jgi:hypothetical protein
LLHIQKSPLHVLKLKAKVVAEPLQVEHEIAEVE